MPTASSAERRRGLSLTAWEARASIATRPPSPWLSARSTSTSLFYGDGVITPAISVLSAIEGLKVVSLHFKKYVIPITLVVLFCLFAVQKRGTGGIGKFFGPITLVWFAS